MKTTHQKQHALKQCSQLTLTAEKHADTAAQHANRTADYMCRTEHTANDACLAANRAADASAEAHRHARIAKFCMIATQLALTATLIITLC